MDKVRFFSGVEEACIAGVELFGERDESMEMGNAVSVEFLGNNDVNRVFIFEFIKEEIKKTLWGFKALRVCQKEILRVDAERHGGSRSEGGVNITTPPGGWWEFPYIYRWKG